MQQNNLINKISLMNEDNYANWIGQGNTFIWNTDSIYQNTNTTVVLFISLSDVDYKYFYAINRNLTFKLSDENGNEITTGLNKSWYFEVGCNSSYKFF